MSERKLLGDPELEAVSYLSNFIVHEMRRSRMDQLGSLFSPQDRAVFKILEALGVTPEEAAKRLEEQRQPA